MSGCAGSQRLLFKFRSVKLAGGKKKQKNRASPSGGQTSERRFVTALNPKHKKMREHEKRADLRFTSVNFQDPDIRNEKVTRILRLLVMLMGPNLKRNFTHILKSNNEISFRCSNHFSLALMISRSERRERAGGRWGDPQGALTLFFY